MNLLKYQSSEWPLMHESMIDHMADFEKIVLAQKPAETPWTPVTDYSFEARKAIEGQHPQLIQDVLQPDAKGVINRRDLLDVGCGPGHLVTLLRALGIDAIGWDLHPPAGGVVADITHPWMDEQFRYDVVVCREVLEHLTLLQVRVALRNLCHKSSRLVYITTRFSSEHDLLRVETSDTLDPTHITLPAKDLYRLLLTLEGFKRRADLEERMDHMHKGRVLVYERV